MMETVRAVRAEIQGEHLVFLDARGRLAGLFPDGTGGDLV